MRSCREMGIRSVAVFSEADRTARHVLYADEAVLIGPAASKDSYLNIEKIIRAAKQHKVDAIHPGYGFLSENADFARRCKEEGIVFIDPHTLDIIRVSTCHYDNSLTKQYAGWDIPTSDAVRNELSHFYENPGLMPQVERLLTLASEHKSHLNFSREG